VIVHHENAQPIQVEDRWVNPACAPAYLAQDYTRVTPNEHLMAAAPLQDATYSIEALPAPREVAEMLAIAARQRLPGAASAAPPRRARWRRWRPCGIRANW
jgi:DNA-binding GntR family transcriptional regulator